MYHVWVHSVGLDLLSVPYSNQTLNVNLEVGDHGTCQLVARQQVIPRLNSICPNQFVRDSWFYNAAQLLQFLNEVALCQAPTLLSVACGMIKLKKGPGKFSYGRMM